MTATPVGAADEGDAVCSAECARQLALARTATDKYHDFAQAPANGYVPVTGCESSDEGAMGEHYMNLVRAAADQTVDLLHPELVLYEPDGTTRRLVAIEYWVPVTVDGVPYNVSAPPDPARMAPAAAPRIYDRTLKGPEPPGDVGEPWHYELHVWSWRDNPHGLFADWNPSVHCP